MKLEAPRLLATLYTEHLSLMQIAHPTPSPQHVERFRQLIFELKGVSLEPQEAYEQCQRFVHYIYYTEYSLPDLRAQEQRK